MSQFGWHLLAKMTGKGALFLAAVLSSTYVYNYWQWRQAFMADVTQLAPAVERPVVREKSNYTELANLFGSVKVEPAAAPVKESTLSIKLAASYVGGKGRSAAVIASSESNHKLYYQGDTLLPGVELVTVQARRVLIKRNGVLESVSLEDSRQSAPSQPRAVVAASQPVVVPVVPEAEPISQQKLTDKLNKLKALASGEM